MLGWPEIIIILALFLLVVGPSKLPEIMRSLGLAVNELKKATSEVDGESKSLEQTTSMTSVKDLTRAQRARSIRTRTIATALRDDEKRQNLNGHLNEEKLNGDELDDPNDEEQATN